MRLWYLYREKRFKSPVSTGSSTAVPEFLEIEKSPVIALECIRLACQVGQDPGVSIGSKIGDVGPIPQR